MKYERHHISCSLFPGSPSEQLVLSVTQETSVLHSTDLCTVGGGGTSRTGGHQIRDEPSISTQKAPTSSQ